jgi:hypothetical protein
MVWFSWLPSIQYRGMRCRRRGGAVVEEGVAALHVLPVAVVADLDQCVDTGLYGDGVDVHGVLGVAVQIASDEQRVWLGHGCSFGGPEGLACGVERTIRLRDQLR